MQPGSDDESSAATTPEPFLRQVARAYRFLNRYTVARVSVKLDFSDGGAVFNDAEDYLWAFFQNCWHIKDWIRNDPRVANETKDRVWEAVRTTRSLRLAADLANGSKHFSEDPKRNWLGAKEGVIHLRLGDDGAASVDHVIVCDDGSEELAIAVAHQAMRDWQRILHDVGLPYYREAET